MNFQLRHNHLYKLILDENKKYEENERQFIEETQQLKYILGKNDGILAKWLKDNAERDAAIRRLQDDMKEGLTVRTDNNNICFYLVKSVRLVIQAISSSWNNCRMRSIKIQNNSLEYKIFN